MSACMSGTRGSGVLSNTGDVLVRGVGGVCDIQQTVHQHYSSQDQHHKRKITRKVLKLKPTQINITTEQVLAAILTRPTPQTEKSLGKYSD